MSDCIGCALSDAKLQDLESAANQQKSAFINVLLTLRVMLESDEHDEALELLNDLTDKEGET